MTWNYRVVHRKYKGRNPEYDEDIYQIHEIYYDENGRAIAASVEAVPAYANDMEGLKWVLEKFSEAYKSEVLEWDSIPEKTNKCNTTTPETEIFGITPEGE